MKGNFTGMSASSQRPQTPNNRSDNNFGASRAGNIHQSAYIPGHKNSGPSKVLEEPIKVEKNRSKYLLTLGMARKFIICTHFIRCIAKGQEEVLQYMQRP